VKSYFLSARLIVACALSAAGDGGFRTATTTCPYVPGAEPPRYLLQQQPLIRNDGKAVAAHTAYTYLYHDDEALYVGPSWHTSMDQLQPGFKMPDGTPKRDAERIRIFIRTDIESDVTYEIAVSASCKIQERAWRDDQADDSWTAGTTARNERWKNDYYWNWVKIPWEGLGGKPAPGTEWGFNYAREEAVTGEHANWAGVVGDENLPRKLGVMRFPAPDDVWLCGWYFPSPLSNNNRLTCGIKGNDGTLVSRILISDGEGEAFEWSATTFLQADAYRWYEHNFSLPRGAPVRVQSVMTSGETVMSATPAVPMDQLRANEVLARLGETFNDLVAGAPGIKNVDARKEFLSAVRPLRTQTHALTRQVAQALEEPPSRERSAAIDKASAELETLDHRSHLLASTLVALKEAQAEVPGFSVGHTHSLVKLRTFQSEVDYGGPVQIELARRERESAQLVVVPFNRPLEGVTATWTDLAGPDKTKLSADNIRIDVVGYVKTQPGGYPTPWVGWWPDPLMPLEPTDVPVDRIAPLWVTAYAPPGTPAGVYRGTVTVTTVNAGSADVPLEVEVWDYDLPLRGKLKNAFGSMFTRTASVWYGYGWMKNSIKTPQQIPQDFRRKMYAFLLEHRINPCGLYEQHVFPDQEDIDFCLERGMNTLFLSYSPNASNADMVAYLKDWREFLKARDALDVAVIYGWDEIESRPQQFPKMVEEWTALKKIFPDISFASTIMHPYPEWDGFIDIWIPHVASFNSEEWAEHLAKSPNDQVWWYTTCETPPYAGILTDVPAIKHRILFWQNYQYRLPGYLYYAILEWKENDPGPDKPRWPDVPWKTNVVHGGHNGCGQLVYPGKEGLLASVRLAVIRDGIEDYEAFAVLEELTGALEKSGKDPALVAANREMLKVPAEVSRSIKEYTDDPLVLLKHRRLLAEQIVRTKSLLEGSEE